MTCPSAPPFLHYAIFPPRRLFRRRVRGRGVERSRHPRARPPRGGVTPGASTTSRRPAKKLETGRYESRGIAETASAHGLSFPLSLRPRLLARPPAVQERGPEPTTSTPLPPRGPPENRSSPGFIAVAIYKRLADSSCHGSCGKRERRRGLERALAERRGRAMDARKNLG